jgi:polyphosphate:AMP phosphotransferase
MFETAELGRKLDKEDYKKISGELRTELLSLQHQLMEADFPVIILVNGVDGAGKGEVVNMLNEWMDTRDVRNVAFGPPNESERHRPPYWRYWMALPAAGKIGIFTGAWYTDPIVSRARGDSTDADIDAELIRVNAFEKTLVDDGALIIKIWLHISKKGQKKKFKQLAKDPTTSWRVTKRDKKHAKLYDTFRQICERTIRETSTGEAPWRVVEAQDARYRDVTVAQHIATRLQQRLEMRPEPHEVQPEPPTEDPYTILDTLDLSLSLPKDEYKERLGTLQAKLNQLSRKASEKQVGVTIVFEGADAAGKGGAIRRLQPALDARHCQVIQVAAPTDEEGAHHYLWRFWRHLPRLGRFTIYDRSWYGRVLVERVEGFTPQSAWMRAYKEINDFEEQLVDFGVVLFKFWLHISSEEQLRRFEARERTPWKQYKITEEDYRNREKANQYERAANEMIERTSTEYAPWTLVECEDKRYGRVKVLQTVCDGLEAALRK